MACCIVAAYLAALMRAKLREWAAFWGLVRRPDGEPRDTAWLRVGLAFRRHYRRGRAAAASTALSR